MRSSEARFRLFFESMPLPVIVYDHETLRILDANTNTTEHYGYSRAELLSMTMLDIRPPEARSRFLETLHALPDDARSVGIWQHIKKDGTIIDVDVTSYGLELDGRRVRLTVLEDVTEQLAMQEALRNSEERLRIIAEVTTDVIWDFDLITRLTTYTQGMHTIFGYELGRISAFDWWANHITRRNGKWSSQSSTAPLRRWTPIGARNTVSAGQTGSMLTCLIAPISCVMKRAGPYA